MQRVDGEFDGMPASSDSSEPDSTVDRVLLGNLACRFELPMLLQKIHHVDFSWNRPKPCYTAPSQVQHPKCTQVLECPNADVFILCYFYYYVLYYVVILILLKSIVLALSM